MLRARDSCPRVPAGLEAWLLIRYLELLQLLLNGDVAVRRWLLLLARARLVLLLSTLTLDLNKSYRLVCSRGRLARLVVTCGTFLFHDTASVLNFLARISTCLNGCIVDLSLDSTTGVADILRILVMCSV